MIILFTTITTLLLAASVLLAQPSRSQESLHVPPRLLATVIGEDPPAIPVYSFIEPLTCYPQPEIFFPNPGESALPHTYSLFDNAEAVSTYADTHSIYGHDWRAPMKRQFDILNIVGYRMTRHPESVVALRGCYTSESGENAGVAIRRSEEVRRYLSGIWGISEERLPVREPQKIVPQFNDTLLLEEGRRVDFITEDLTLFRRLDFLSISYKTEITPINVSVLPNVDPERVALVTVRLLDDEGSVLDSVVLNGSEDAEVYRGRVRPNGIAEDQPPPFESLTLQCSLLLRNGEVRTADPVTVRIRSAVEDYGVIAHENISADEVLSLRIVTANEIVLPFVVYIPGYGPGDVDLSPLQKLWIRESLSALEAEGIDPVDGLLVAARGEVTLPEDRSAGESESVLSGTEVPEMLSDLANRRADGVTSYLRDSLGIPLLNAEWPDSVPCPFYSISMVDPAMWKRGNLPNDALRTDIEPVVEYRQRMREVFLLIGTRKDMELWLKD